MEYWDMLGTYEQGFFMAAAKSILECGPDGETYEDVIEMIREVAGEF